MGAARVYRPQDGVSIRDLPVAGLQATRGRLAAGIGRRRREARASATTTLDSQLADHGPSPGSRDASSRRINWYPRSGNTLTVR